MNSNQQQSLLENQLFQRANVLDIWQLDSSIMSKISCRTDTGINVKIKVFKSAEIFKGHFPDFPILPGVYLIDFGLQVIEKFYSEKNQQSVTLVELEVARFFKPVLPDDEIFCVAECKDIEKNIWNIVFYKEKIKICSASYRLQVAGEPDFLTQSQGAVNTKKNESNRVLCSEEIKQILMHRDPILLVDQVSDYLPKNGLNAFYKILNSSSKGNNEQCFNSIFPSVLIVESFAQSCGVFLSLEQQTLPVEEEQVMLFGSMHKIKFLREVKQNNELCHQLHLKKNFGSVAMFSGETYVGNDLVATFDEIQVAHRPKLILSR